MRLDNKVLQKKEQCFLYSLDFRNFNLFCYLEVALDCYASFMFLWKGKQRHRILGGYISLDFPYSAKNAEQNMVLLNHLIYNADLKAVRNGARPPA